MEVDVASLLCVYVFVTLPFCLNFFSEYLMPNESIFRNSIRNVHQIEFESITEVSRKVGGKGFVCFNATIAASLMDTMMCC